MSKFTCMRITIRAPIDTPNGQEDVQATFDIRVESLMYLVSSFINVLECEFPNTEQHVFGLSSGIAVSVWQNELFSKLLTARMEEVFVLPGIVGSVFDGMRPTKSADFTPTFEKAFAAFQSLKADRVKAAARRELVDA